MRAVAVAVAGFAVAILVGGLTGALIIAGVFVAGAMFVVSDVRALGDEQLRDEVSVGRSTPVRPADANAGVDA